jgi:Flp pilus assembly protein TadD
MRLRAIACVLATVAAGACGASPGPTEGTAPPPPPTFSKDVAPILAAHCASCHRPGQGTPFNLLSYADARSRAADLARVTSARIMPPWLPDPIEPRFVGERRLTPDQISILKRWAETGASPGDPLPDANASELAGAWSIGKPDLVVQPARPYRLDPGDDDVFRNLVIRLTLPSDRFVRAVEFQPGSARVHHAVVHLDRTSASRERDGQDGQPGFEGMGATGTQDPDGHFIGWAPGRGPIVSAAGRPWRLPRGADVVIELHLIRQSKPVAVQPALGVYFADAPLDPPPILFKMGSKPLDIPAGATDYEVRDEYTLPAEVDLLSLYPHAHFLGKTMQVSAQVPDGGTRTLLFIRRWSFHWQQDYRFTQPVKLPRGTKVVMRFTYDNSENNPDNPNRPPIRVLSGRRSTDEMGNLLLQLVPRSAADRTRIVKDLAARDAAANVAVAEQMVRFSPDSAEPLTQLGGSYADAGRLSDAIAALEKALRLDAQYWKAHHELGGALYKSGRIPEAIGHFGQAARLRPADAHVQFNLGKALAASGSIAAAQSAFGRALALNPRFGEAHQELGVLLFGAGRIQEAIRHLRNAVELSPDSATAHSDLGGALAQAGRAEEALTHIRMALAIDPDNAAARENLSRLQRGR